MCALCSYMSIETLPYLYLVTLKLKFTNFKIVELLRKFILQMPTSISNKRCKFEKVWTNSFQVADI